MAKTIQIEPRIAEKFGEGAIACPYGKLLATLGKPHTLEILYSFGVRSPLRFTEIQKSLKLQPKTVAVRLREAVKLGLLTRKAYNEIPPRVDYELTQKGKDLDKMFNALHDWAEKYHYIELPRIRKRVG